MPGPNMVEAWLANQRLEQLENYLKRGRSLADVPIDGLRVRWIELMRSWAQNVKGGADHHEREDIEAEMQLRKQEPPYNDVNDAMETLRRKSKEATDRLLRDPAGIERIERELSEQIAQLKATAKGKKN